MKKIFTLVCAALMTLGTVSASVLFTESFNRDNYVVGGKTSLSASTWSSGELPNDSNWHTYSPGTNQFIIVEQQLAHTDYCSALSGKAVQYRENNSRDYRLFKDAFNGSAGDKVYLAFLLKVNTLKTGSGPESSTNANNCIMGLAINASNNAMGSVNGRIIIKTVNESTYNLGVSRRGEAPQFASTNLSAGSTYLIVAEYDFVSGEKNDIVSLYINPSKASQIIEVSSINPSTASADTEVLLGAVLCSNGNTPKDMLIDEIRVATSWDDLWEGGGGGSDDPVINVASTAAFGSVTVNEAVSKDITVSGNKLTDAISVVSNNAAVVPSVSSISKAQAEAAGGFKLTLTLTAAAAGDGSAKVTLSSAGASDKVINVSWSAIVPPTKIANIAAMKITGYDADKFYEIESEPVIIRQSLNCTVLQDASGALVATNYLGDPLSSYSVGDKVKIKKAQLYEVAMEYIDGFHTIVVLDDAFISAGNTVTPLELNTGNFDFYGPALVKLLNVGFKNPGTQFAKGVYDITDENGTGFVYIPDACDIIGEDISAKADITGLVVRVSGKNAIRIESKSDVQAKGGGTGIDQVQSDKVQGTKVIENGVLYIVKDGKMFNVLGTEL